MNIRNVSGEVRLLPALDLVVDVDEVFTVDDEELAASLLDQPANWAEEEE